MRVVQQLLISIALTMVGGVWSCSAYAQDLLGAPPADITPPSAAAQAASKLTEADNANLEGCQVIARVDDQVILACELLWRVNQMLEEYQRKAPPGQRVPQDQLEITRKQLMQKEVAGMVDRKLLFNQFRRSVPAEQFPVRPVMFTREVSIAVQRISGGRGSVSRSGGHAPRHALRAVQNGVRAQALAR